MMAESTLVNPSTAHATVLVDELVRCGVREVVLCPGSRSAPLAYAVQQAERAGRLRLHVRIDERSGGFLALGLARASGRPTVVVTTSGTAVANLHPAVLEAHHGEVPLVVVTADRPAELRGTGANQTTAQPGIFGPATRFDADVPAAESRPGQNAGWRSTVARATATAQGLTGDRPGPVHVNLALRDPLVPDDGGDWPEPLAGRVGGMPWVAVAPGPAAYDLGASPIEDIERTVVVLGDTGSGAGALMAAQWATGRGYPLVAEPFGSLNARAVALPHGPLVLTAAGWLDAHAPERVVVVGRPTLARAVGDLLRRPGVRVEAVSTGRPWPDPSHVVARVHPWSAMAADLAGSQGPTPARSAWAAGWDGAGADVAQAVAAHGPPWPSGLAVAGVVVEALPDDALLVLGSSNPVRDLDLALGGRPAGPHAGIEVVANRGLAGIDGIVSTAVGAALARPERPAYALLGDLTFLHDANGLTIGPGEPRPDLTVVVVNDDGGGIFATLEHGVAELADRFERVFGTPTGTDLAALCGAHGVEHALAASPAELGAAVSAHPEGLRVVEVRVDRATHRVAHAGLLALAANTLGAGSS
jgi:2-succinyl-5-enolpyruvyl-6-hydroxy-3-cyclohexene-1-carboxylate synthase